MRMIDIDAREALRGMSPEQKWERARSIADAEAMQSGQETLTVLSGNMTPDQANLIRPKCLPWFFVRIPEHTFLIGLCDQHMRPCRWRHLLSRSFRIAVFTEEGDLLMSCQPTEPKPLWQHWRDHERKRAFVMDFIRVLAEGPGR